MDNELELEDIINPVVKNWRFVAYFTISVFVLTFLVTLAWPKTYESVSTIQLGRVDGEIFPSIESKYLLQSSQILGSIIANLSEEDIGLYEFREEMLDVIILTETIGRDTKQINFLRVAVRADEPLKAMQENEEILKNFFAYVAPFYNKKLAILQEEDRQTRMNLDQLEGDIRGLQKQIDSVNGYSLSSEAVSKSTLLSDIINSYKSRFLAEQNHLIDIQGKLAGSRQYLIISEPQIPVKPISPNLPVNLLVGFAIGIVLGSLVIIIKANWRN